METRSDCVFKWVVTYPSHLAWATFDQTWFMSAVLHAVACFLHFAHHTVSKIWVWTTIVLVYKCIISATKSNWEDTCTATQTHLQQNDTASNADLSLDMTDWSTEPQKKTIITDTCEADKAADCVQKGGCPLRHSQDIWCKYKEAMKQRYLEKLIAILSNLRWSFSGAACCYCSHL